MHIEATFQRPFEERTLRRIIEAVPPNRRRFAAASIARPSARPKTLAAPGVP